MPRNNQSRNICVVVLGDIGRSPRMQYHVKSLIQQGFNVDLIGYMETKPLSEITADPNTRIHPLTPFPDSNLPSTVKYLFKTFWQLLTLFVALSSARRPEFLLCQNPPGIPTLFVCYCYCLLMRSRMIIDWHNYTYTILALTSNPKGILVRTARWIERFFGRKSTANLCVTKAMQMDLERNWGISATVLYDRPAPCFKSISLNDKHDLFMRLGRDYPQFLPPNCDDFKSSGVIESTAFTQKLNSGGVTYKSSRPGLIVSSTSWTPDEDFSILLKALELYEKNAVEQPDVYPNLICAITGKGPQKEFYKKVISEKKWTKISVITPWLDAEDYPILLASSDLGVSLHWSSSGLDLPMKVVDMFGCGLPVCAIRFNCLTELVQHEENGFIFDDHTDLADHISEWFFEFPNNISLVNVVERFQQNLKKFQSLRWNENWNKNAFPLFK